MTTTLKAYTCTPVKSSPSSEDRRLMYAFSEYEEALESTNLYGPWVWEVEIELDPYYEEGYCWSSGEGDEWYKTEWGIHPTLGWVMYTPNLIKGVRLVCAPGCL